MKNLKNVVEQTEIIYSIDLINEENNNLDCSYDIKINEELFNECDDNSCVVEVEMFNADVIYYNGETKIKTSTLENEPKLIFENKKFSAIN